VSATPTPTPTATATTMSCVLISLPGPSSLPPVAARCGGSGSGRTVVLRGV
jgi:hypothetical protein